ncbi:MAG: hypothetical protein WCL00_13930 [Bacteroidota bacterium]
MISSGCKKKTDPVPEPITVTDIDGNVYHLVTINIAVYGHLYNWYTVNRKANGSSIRWFRD